MARSERHSHVLLSALAVFSIFVGLNVLATASAIASTFGSDVPFINEIVAFQRTEQTDPPLDSTQRIPTVDSLIGHFGCSPRLFDPVRSLSPLAEILRSSSFATSPAVCAPDALSSNERHRVDAIDTTAAQVSTSTETSPAQMVQGRHDFTPASTTAPELIATKSAPGVGGACSFEGTTRVLMADGTTKRIEDVRVGDSVLAQVPETGEKSARKVTHLWVHDDEYVRLEIDGATVLTTANHPFWNDTDQKWERADELNVGDMVLTADGRRVRVGHLQSAAGHGAAYNLTVEGLHTYHVLVGHDAVLVHNVCPTAESISNGHAFEKHVIERGEFPGVRTRAEFAEVIDDVMTNPQQVRSLSNGRTAYWKNGVVVIKNPGAGDLGTAFVPDKGISYFNGLK